MRIGLFGMGYAGAVCAACLAESGHSVIGVDDSELKVDLINRGKSPVLEPGLEALLRRQVAAGRVCATSDASGTVLDTDLSMICVRTPSPRDGGVQLDGVEAVARQIGAALKQKRGWHTVVVRSTVLPGTTRNVIIPLLEQASGKRAGADFGVAVNPEFLRESTAIQDYYHPPMTVVGQLDDASGEVLAALYAGLPAPLVRRPLEVAEMVKYACNAWLATKITFANEIGNFAKAHGVDGRDVMDLVCMDRKLNISNYCMRPGFAFGGSALPRDLRTLEQSAQQLELDLPMLTALMRSNRAQVDQAMKMVAATGKKRIGLLGLSFGAEPDDLRESPLVDLAELLIGQGYQLAIYDGNVDGARGNGASRDYIGSRIPQVSSLLKSDLAEVIEACDVMVLGHRDRQFEEVLHNLPDDKIAVDLVGFMQTTSNAAAQGIGW